MNNLHEISMLLFGSATALIVSAFCKETVEQRYNVGCVMLATALIFFFLT